MSALAIAMLLTGAGQVAAPNPPRPLPPVYYSPPSPPPPIYLPPPPPPPPPRGQAPRRERANLNSYFSGDDYPAAAIRAEAQGTTGFRLEIGRDGRVRRCWVTSSSGNEALDQATCRIMLERARYAPARDARGRRIRGTDRGRVSWRLPNE